MFNIRVVAGYYTGYYLFGYSVDDINKINISDEIIRSYISYITSLNKKIYLSDEFGILEVYCGYSADINNNLKNEYDIHMRSSNLIKVGDNIEQYYSITNLLNNTIKEIKYDYNKKINSLENKIKELQNN